MANGGKIVPHLTIREQQELLSTGETVPEHGGTGSVDTGMSGNIPDGWSIPERWHNLVNALQVGNLDGDQGLITQTRPRRRTGGPQMSRDHRKPSRYNQQFFRQWAVPGPLFFSAFVRADHRPVRPLPRLHQVDPVHKAPATRSRRPSVTL